MSFPLQNRKTLGTVGVILALAIGTGVWYANDSYRRKQAYQGVVEEAYKSRNWLRGARKPNRPAYRYYKYYWRVRDESGKLRTVRVNHALWPKGEPGTPVKKVAGERYPQVDTAEAEEQRQIKDQVIGETVNRVLDGLE